MRPVLNNLMAFGFAVSAPLVVLGSASAQNVGSVGAVNQDAAGTPPGAAAHALSVGGSVVNKERIATKAEGTAHLTFTDKSTLNVGRNSSVTIDKFVYNESAGTGEMATSMTKGVLRFVGGQVSHTTGATVKTPVATIGVRGGTMTVVSLGGGRIMVVDQYGRIEVTNNVSHQTIMRAGYAVEVDGLNATIGEPFPVPPDVLAKAMAQLRSRNGQHGGAHHWPDNTTVARNGIGNGRLPNDPNNTPGPQMIGTIGLGDNFVANRSQQQQVNGVILPITPQQPFSGNSP